MNNNSGYSAEPQAQAYISKQALDEMSDSEFHARIEKDMCIWNTNGEKTVFWPGGITTPKLEPGLYCADNRERTGTCLVKQLVYTDNLIEFPDSDSDYIIQEIDRFWKLEHEYKSRGLTYKRGVLLAGDPGAGKTSTIQMLIKKVVASGGIAIYPHNFASVTAEALQLVRRIEPNTPIILIMEDFETLIAAEKEENRWLSMLDGESQINKVVFLATTNYIEKLGKRFVDRPSRFDLIQFVKMPSRAAREKYLNVKEPGLQGSELQEWLDRSEGFSVAHLKEMIISVKVLGYDLDDTIKRLEEMRERKYTSEKNLEGVKPKKRFGFQNDD